MSDLRGGRASRPNRVPYKRISSGDGGAGWVLCGAGCGWVLMVGMVTRSVLLFILAGFLEIGGGYLVWQWMRVDKAVAFAIVGGVMLALYGVVAALQPAHFGRVYAAYGGVFIAMSIVWGWAIDGIRPDRYDLVGGALALAGVVVMMYAPRP